jgi:hypothetical protein
MLFQDHVFIQGFVDMKVACLKNLRVEKDWAVIMGLLEAQ